MTTTRNKTKESTKHNYQIIAPLYKEDFDKDYSDLPILVDDVIGYLKKENLQGEILDVGCGTGILTRYLKQKKITNHITGVDFTHEFIVDYQKEFPHESIVESDFVDFLKKTKIKNCAGIFFNWSFFHIPESETEKVLKSCYRLLFPNGVIYMSLHKGTFIGMETDPYQQTHDKRLKNSENIQCYMRYYAEKDIERKLGKTGFKIMKLVTQKFEKVGSGDFAVDKIYVFAKK